MNRDTWFEVSKHVNFEDWIKFIRVCKLFNSFKKPFDEMIKWDGRLDNAMEEFIYQDRKIYNPRVGSQVIESLNHHVIFDYILEMCGLGTNSLKYVCYLKYNNLSFIAKYQSHFDKEHWRYFYQRGYIPYNKSKDLLKEIWSTHLSYLNPTHKVKFADLDCSSKKLLVKHGNLAYKDFDVRNIHYRDLWKLEDILHRFDWEEVKQDLDILGYRRVSKSRLTIKIVKEMGVKKWSWPLLTRNLCFTKYDILDNLNLPWYWPNLLRNPNIKPKDLLEFPNLPIIISKLRSYVVSNIEIIDELPSCINLWDWNFISKRFMFYKTGYRNWFWNHIHLPWDKEALKINNGYRYDKRLQEFLNRP